MTEILRALVDLTPSTDAETRRGVMREASKLFSVSTQQFDKFTVTASALVNKAEKVFSEHLFGRLVPVFEKEDRDEFKRYANIIEQDMSVQSDQKAAFDKGQEDILSMIELRLRARAVQANPGLAPQRIEQSLGVTHDACMGHDGNLPDDWDEAQTFVTHRLQSGFLSPFFLPKLWHNGETSRFYAAFCHMCNVDYKQANAVLLSADKTALALVCRGAKFDVALFEILANLTGQAENIHSICDLYPRLSAELAQRTVRFTKVMVAA